MARRGLRRPDREGGPGQAGLGAGGGRGDGRVHDRIQQGPDRVGGTGGDPRADRPGPCAADRACRRGAGGDRRAVRGDPGGAGRLLGRGLRELRPGDPHRWPAGELPGPGRCRRRRGHRRAAGRRLQGRAGPLTRMSEPAAEARLRRLAPHVLYLIFNEGYVSTAGPDLQRAELAAEAIRLARLLHRLLPDDGEVTGLLALMLLTDARRPARTGPDGALIPMAEQDRSRWNADYIAEGVALVTDALPRGPTGPYQLQAAIAAVHDEAPNAGATDWPQIMALYEVLLQISDNPVVALNHVVAFAMV